MTATLTAVYRDGAFHPTSPPPELPDGTTVQLTVIAHHPAAPTPSPQEVFRMLKAIADMPEEGVGDPTVTARDHDRTLYGGPGGAR